MEYEELNKQFWGQHLWARGYFVASSGNVRDESVLVNIGRQIFECIRLPSVKLPEIKTFKGFRISVDLFKK